VSTLPLFFKGYRKHFSLRLGLLPCLLLCTGALSMYAQNSPYDRPPSDPPDRPRYDQGDRSSAGGNWLEFDSEDSMTAVRKVRLELTSDNSLRENRAVQSRIEIFCEKGKFKGSEFTPGIMLGPPTHPGFWGQPKMEVRVRIDNAHGNRGWNWNGRSLLMDKNTTRELLGAQIFRIEFLGRNGPEIAEFSPGGIYLDRFTRGCDLTPKRP